MNAGFFNTINILKSLPRTGWLQCGVKKADAESVASHSWRTAILADRLCPNSLDRNIAMRMALVHDLGESLIGDIPPGLVSKTQKQEMEFNAMKALSSFAEEYFVLFSNFEDKNTAEALFIRDCDCFDMMLQAFEYEILQGVNLAEFWEYAAVFKWSYLSAQYEALGKERDWYLALPSQHRYFYKTQYDWSRAILPFVQGSVIDVGSGIGMGVHFLAQASHDVTSVDISKSSIWYGGDVHPNIYDGESLPYTDNQFDTAVVSYVLHHTKYPYKLLDEVMRVSRRIIIVEEPFNTLVGWMSLFVRDMQANISANQKCDIYPSSYFKKGDIETYMKSKHWKLVYTTERKHYKYFKQVLVFDKNA